MCRADTLWWVDKRRNSIGLAAAGVVFWVELESVSYVKTQVIEGVEASCRTKFKCDNSDDWNFWEVMVSPGSP